MIQAVFFDLDGTLLDTAPDLCAALNSTLQQFDRAPVTLEILRPYLYSSKAIIHCGFQLDETHTQYQLILETFLNIYQHCSTAKTNLFPGMDSLLHYLDHQKIHWGVVTNKPKFLTEPLLAHFNLSERSKCIISGDSLPFKKPHPLPLTHACELVNVDPKHAVYIGDNQIDILAAKSAGLYSIAVTYGYHSKENAPENWEADYLITNPMELINWLMLKNSN